MPVCNKCGAFFIRSPCPSCGYNKEKKQTQIIKDDPLPTRPSSISQDPPSWESANKEMSLKRSLRGSGRIPNFSPNNKAVTKGDLQEFKDEIHRTLKQVVNLIEQLLEKTA
jgi:predicted  nucleic acid-binding Zn-ribbon protein